MHATNYIVGLCQLSTTTHHGHHYEAAISPAKTAAGVCQVNTGPTENG